MPEIGNKRVMSVGEKQIKVGAKGCHERGRKSTAADVDKAGSRKLPERKCRLDLVLVIPAISHNLALSVPAEW